MGSGQNYPIVLLTKKKKKWICGWGRSKYLSDFFLKNYKHLMISLNHEIKKISIRMKWHRNS
jgi:hypothetical protein